MRRYEVYLNCSTTGKLEFPYEVEAESAQKAGAEVVELADDECEVHGKHTVYDVKPSGSEVD